MNIRRRCVFLRIIDDGTCLYYGFKDVFSLLQKPLKVIPHIDIYSENCARQSNHPVSCLSLQKGKRLEVILQHYQAAPHTSDTQYMYIIRYLTT